MARFYVADPVMDRGEIVVSGPEAHHMQRVLRLKRGDRVEIFDGTGRQYQGLIARQDRRSVRVKILEIRGAGGEVPFRVVMGQSLIKGDKMDSVIQKASELGVSELVPFVSSRSIPRLDRDRREVRMGRWRKIAIESSKQSGRPIPLRVEDVVDFHEALRRHARGAVRIILWERARKGLRSFFKEKEDPLPVHDTAYFLVGPEGGFSEQEVAEAEEAHFVAVRLGPRIMRVETAGLALLSILQYEWGDWG
ncbi:MAG: 16S rRNA (uracil(1498)-N(3))-methyltransferase [Deltaproteobacteria bacterium]|nr:16S rRNA (uracil(1498)-N(3))-methyltransferase [Deltaproteobacteria bacterium]MBW2120793.1 16S rRNA (uracil(1498)-N(3))-methyltransferase [Deltaproteobacteria bacterium]